MIDFIFGLLNLGIVVGVIVYYVRSSVASQLRENIIRVYHDFQHLHEEQRSLAQEQKRLESSIITQEDRAKMLFKKVNHWRNSVDLKREAAIHKQDQVMQEVDRKAAEQLRSFVLHQAYSRVAPEVIKTLSNELKAQYADPNEAHAYLAHIITTLPIEKQ